jgi:hypothetical protein
MLPAEKKSAIVTNIAVERHYMLEPCVSRHLLFQVGHPYEGDAVVFVVIGEESNVVVAMSHAS